MPRCPRSILARADYVISFGADFLGTWNSPVAQSIGYGEMRQGRPGRRGKFVQVESRMSQTGANADEWIACQPGMEGALALGIAHVILSREARAQNAGSPAASRAGSLIAGWSAGLPDYTPEAVEKQTGVSAAVIMRLAHEIAQSGSAAAIVGGAPLAQTNGLFNALAVNALESLVDTGRDQGPILGFTPEPPLGNAGDPSVPARASFAQLNSFAQSLLSAKTGAPQMLLLYEANPIFSAPPAAKIREAIAKIPYIVSFGSFIDETSAQADLILPDNAPLESWLESVPNRVPCNRWSASRRLPFHRCTNTRPMPDVLLGVAQQLGGDVAKALPLATFDAMLRAAFVPLRTRGGSDNAKTDDDFWQQRADAGRLVECACRGGIKERRTQVRGDGCRQARANGGGCSGVCRQRSRFSFLLSALRLAVVWRWLAREPALAAGVARRAHDRRCGQAGWRSTPRLAEQLGIQQGDLVEIASPHGSVRAAGDSFARNRARSAGHAGRPGTRELRPLCKRARRESAFDSRAAHGTRKPDRWPGPRHA